jgi:hypothetical protein
MTRLHIALKSNVQFSIGPRGVEAQSTLRANWICRGRAADMGIRVQSKEELPGYPVMTESIVLPSGWDINIDSLGKDVLFESSTSGLDRTCCCEGSAQDPFRETAI